MKVRNASIWLAIFRHAYDGQKAKILYCGLIMVIVIACETISPLIGKQIFDYALPIRSRQLIISLGALWIGAIALAAVLRFAYNISMTKIGNKASKAIKVLALRAFLLEFSRNGDTNRKHGERLSRILNDPEELIRNSGAAPHMKTLVSFVSLVVVTILALYLDWQLALVCLGGAGLTVAYQRRAPKKIKDSNQKIASLRAHVTSMVENLLSAWHIIIRCNKISHELAVAEREVEHLSKANVSAQKHVYSSALCTSLLLGPLPIVLIWVGAYRMMTGAMSLGTLIAFFSYLVMITTSFGGLFGGFLQICSGFGQAKDFVQIVNISSQNDIVSPQRDIGQPLSNITFHNIVITAGNFKLEGDNITLGRGNTYLLIGDSGVGKSSFLEFMAGIRKADRATIYIDEKRYDTKSFMQVARSFGYIKKEEILLDRSVLENIEYGLSDNNMVDIRNYAQILKMDYYSRKKVVGLSAGEKQRVSFIRELVRRPELFIIDEGIDSLNEELKINSLRLIRETLPECILVICSHNWQQQLHIDEVLKISEGQIVECDHPRETAKAKTLG